MNGLDICILKYFGLNWRVAEILSQIGFRGSVNTGEVVHLLVKRGNGGIIMVGFETLVPKILMKESF